MNGRRFGLREWLAAFGTLVGVWTLGVTSGLAQSRPAGAADLSGVLDVTWADPRHGSAGGAVRFALSLPGGERLAAAVAEDQQAVAFQAMGKHVRVTGRLTPAAQGRQIEVDHIEALDPTPATAPPSTAPILTTRRVLFVLLQFQGDTQTPHAPSFYSALTNPKAPNTSLHIPATINGFFDKTSWGQLQWKADVAGAGGLNPSSWLVLPRTKTGYANCGWSGSCADIYAIANDALTMVNAAGVNLSVYDNINFVLNNDLDCCAWGGTYTFNGKTYGATWEPPWGQEAEIYVHEMGHSIGLPHSGWRYYAYDSSWDEMSRGSPGQSVTCGSYFSANDGLTGNLTCHEPGAGYISAHKAWLAWLPLANQLVVTSVSTQTVQLEADSLPLGTGIKTIRICIAGQACTGSTAHYISVEARLLGKLYDRGLTFPGVVLHDVRMNRSPVGGGNSCYFNTQSGWAMPIDSTAGDWVGPPSCNPGGRTYPHYALYNAQYAVGRTYSNTTLGIKVQVTAKTTTGYTVVVTRSK